MRRERRLFVLKCILLAAERDEPPKFAVQYGRHKKVRPREVQEILDSSVTEVVSN